IPRCSASAGEVICTSSPAMRIVPESGWYIPASTFMSVVLPAPFSPRTAWISPGQRSSEMRSLATTGPKRLLMPRISTMGDGRWEDGVMRPSRDSAPLLPPDCGSRLEIRAIARIRRPLAAVVRRAERVARVFLRVMRVENLAADLLGDVFDAIHGIEEFQRVAVQTHQDFVLEVVPGICHIDRKHHRLRIIARLQDH